MVRKPRLHQRHHAAVRRRTAGRLDEVVPGQDRRGVPRDAGSTTPACRPTPSWCSPTRSPAWTRSECAGSRARSRPTRCRPTGWTVQEWLHFLNRATRPQPVARLQELDAAFPADRVQQRRDRARLVPAGACQRLPGTRAGTAELPDGHRAHQAHRAVVRGPAADSAGRRFRAARLRAGTTGLPRHRAAPPRPPDAAELHEAAPPDTARRGAASRVGHRRTDHRRALRARAGLRAGRDLACHGVRDRVRRDRCARTAGKASRRRST